MTTKTAVITGTMIALAAFGATEMAQRRALEKKVAATAAAACPTPRPLAPWVPAGVNYCTQARFYIQRCEASPYTQMWQSRPGFSGQGCGAHTFIVSANDGFNYPIGDQGPGNKGYQKPPVTAPEALSVWTEWYVNHNCPISYNCNITPPPGTLIYQPVKIAQLPEPAKTYWYNFYACCNTEPTPTVTPTVTPSPTPTIQVPPTFPPPPTLTPGCPVCYTPTCGPKPVCTPKPVPTDMIAPPHAMRQVGADGYVESHPAIAFASDVTCFDHPAPGVEMRCIRNGRLVAEVLMPIRPEPMRVEVVTPRPE